MTMVMKIIILDS